MIHDVETSSLTRSHRVLGKRGYKCIHSLFFHATIAVAWHLLALPTCSSYVPHSQSITFVPSTSFMAKQRRTSIFSRTVEKTSPASMSSSNIIDVEPVVEDNVTHGKAKSRGRNAVKLNSKNSVAKSTDSSGYPVSFEKVKNATDSMHQPDGPINLIDLAKLMQPELNVRVPFVDTIQDNYIDCIMHYVVKVNNIQYTIGTPYDHPVGICYKDGKGMNVFVETEDEEQMKELFPIAGRWLEEAFGTDLVLRNTGNTLTIMGNLDEYVKKGKDKEMEMFTSAEFREAIKTNGEKDTIDDYDEEDEFFDQICLDHLGQDYKSLQREMWEKQVNEELRRVESQMQSDRTREISLQCTSPTSLQPDVVAERLFSFEHNGRIFSLARWLQPIILVGKEDSTGLARHLLLTPAESADVMPTLERICADEFVSLMAVLKQNGK